MEVADERSQTQGKRRRRIWISLGIAFALLVIFHRLILLGSLHWYAVHVAEKENLKLDFRAEGNPFTGLTIRNLHIVPTGPAAVEKVDADYIHAEYDLFALLRGRNDFLEAVELRNVSGVIDPAKVRVKATPRRDEKVTLPAVFPERARLVDVSLTVRDPAHDLVVDHLSVELNPRLESTLGLAFLQLPTGEAWKRITGRTSFQNRDLSLRDVTLNEQTHFPLIEVDASHIAARQLGLRLEAVLDNAPVHARATLTEKERSIFIETHLEAKALALASAKKLGLFSAEDVDGTVDNFSADLAGLLSSPRTWSGGGGGVVRDLRVGGFLLDAATVKFVAHDGVTTLQPTTLTRGAATITVNGALQLPERTIDLGRSPAHMEISSDELDLALLTSAVAPPLSGHGRVTGKLEIRDERLRGEMQATADSLVWGDTRVAHAETSFLATKDLRADEENAPWFHRLEVNAALNATAAQFADFAAESVTAQLEQREDRIALKSLVSGRAEAQVSISGSMKLLPKVKDFIEQPASLQVALKAPEVEGFWRPEASDAISGALNASGDLHWDGKIVDGAVNAYGTQLQLRTLRVPTLSLAATVAQSRLFLNDLTARLNERDFVSASGSLNLLGAREFAGRVLVDIADVATLKPALEASGMKTDLGGKFLLDWQGRGSVGKPVDTGALKLTWAGGRFANLKALQANVDATYSPAGLEMPTLFVGTDRMDLQAIVSARGDVLEVSKVQLDQGKAKYAVGNVSVPFLWKNVGTGEPLFPADGQVKATFRSENLDLKKMWEDFGIKAPANGFLNAKIDASGTLSDLRAHAEVDGRDLRNPDLTNIEPATLHLVADSGGRKLTVAGQLKQPRIQPVEITATMPFDAGQVLRAGALDDNTPVDGRIRLPRSAVNFLRQFIPGVEQLDGSVAIDAAVGGTIAHPLLSGSGDIAINAARMTNGTLPALHGFQSRLTFRGDTLTLERFKGDLAGGPFTLGGRVVFTKLTEPNLELELRADSILVARNDSLTARADANLRVAGPFAAATVTGRVALTNSHFLKDIDLLPIGLPGRPAPQPFGQDRPDFSVTEPPIRDWKFDVAITTKDPFSIRGNLANGGAIADLHLGGTGLRPELRGNVRLQNVEATLPFSRLEVTNGFLYFDPSDSFNPKIDIQGTSIIRDYTVRVYVYGTALAPQAIFTSEPPLPQEEIISLLATGATRQELTGNSNVLAGRAASLLIQQLYRKIFKKGQPTRSDTVFDRLQIDLGTVDPRTGQQQATARFKVNQNWVLVGDIGVGGEFRGLVRYLIRFH